MAYQVHINSTFWCFVLAFVIIIATFPISTSGSDTRRPLREHPDNVNTDFASPKPSPQLPGRKSSPTPTSQTPPSKTVNHKILLCLGLGLLFLFVIIGILIWFRKNSIQKPEISILKAGNFTYDQLSYATNGFSPDNQIGEGGFGHVFKGVLSNKMVVAIKKMKPNSAQGEHEFHIEIDIISNVRHRHLVTLVGFCVHGAEKLVVYEFLPNNTLDFHIRRKTLDWETRMRIAIGSAKALAYLHEECTTSIIHRDIKASNVLIDENFEAKLSDLGLAKIYNKNNSHVSSTGLKGTFGYLAPEYANDGNLTIKCDIYSFGIMLLELITGRRPSVLVDATGEPLVYWAKDLLNQGLENGNFSQLVDPVLDENCDIKELIRMLICVISCIYNSPEKRPKMSQVVTALQEDICIEELKKWMIESPESNYNASQNIDDHENFKRMIMSSELSPNTSQLVSIKGDEQV